MFRINLPPPSTGQRSRLRLYL